MDTASGLPRDNGSCQENYEDWGCSLDDKGAEFWDEYLGGPDDEDLERYYEDLAQDQALYSFGEDDDENQSDNEVGAMSYVDQEAPASRLEEIVQWLSKSSLARKFKEREGFFVRKGSHVRLKDGNVVDLLEWLFDEGLKGGIAVSDYSIVYSSPESPYGEKLSFFKVVVDAPFSRRKLQPNNGVFDDDIPF